MRMKKIVTTIMEAKTLNDRRYYLSMLLKLVSCTSALFFTFDILKIVDFDGKIHVKI